MRDKVTIELSVVEAATLELELFGVLQAYAKRANARQHYTPKENRLIKLFETVSKQQNLKEEEEAYADMVIEADNESYRNQN